MFAACQKFDSRCGDSWSQYIEWSGFHHIQEIVSIDTMLCPSLIDTLIDDDWKFNIHADYRVYFFHNLEYLKRRIKYDSSRVVKRGSLNGTGLILENLGNLV